MNKENKIPFGFLTSTDDTGRFVVVSQRTGKIYCVEPIDNGRRGKKWGDINPTTKKVEGSYGSKHKGSVTEDESMITKENGFEDIRYGNPMDVIAEMDARHLSL